jgi:CRP-like cAMP-binding protein
MANWGYDGSMIAPPNIAAELRRAYLFADMEETHLAHLAGSMRQVHLEPGARLFHQGESAGHFYFLRTGLIKLYRLSPEGDEKIIELIHPGQTFAEAVMFMGQRRVYPVNAEAVAGTSVYAFEQATFMNLLTESKEACFGLIGSMSRRLHMLINQIDHLTLQNATYRLVGYLIEQIPADAHTREVVLETPKSVIAAHLAIQPETLSRILAKLRKGGLIEVEGNHITVRDIPALRQYAHLPQAS